jgi:uncharacterized membrane protein YecN with MAPEG domain
MPLSITALYGAILALIVVALGINVTVYRAKLKIPLGDGGNAQMLRMIRLHGNAIEYVPLAIVLMLAYELNGGGHTALNVIGIALVAGRLAQSWTMWSTHMPGRGRQVGQSLTWLSIVALAALNILKLI